MPIILAYNLSHYESLHPCTESDILATVLIVLENTRVHNASHWIKHKQERLGKTNKNVGNPKAVIRSTEEIVNTITDTKHIKEDVAGEINLIKEDVPGEINLEEVDAYLDYIGRKRRISSHQAPQNKNIRCK